MPASSQASPTSGMRVTSSPHLSQVMTTSSIHGRCSSRRPSSPRTARCSSSAARADHRHVAARARVDRQRQAEVPLARDVPVAHVPQPVVHPLRVEGRRPFDRCVRVEHRLPDLLGRDEPVVDDAEEERRLAAPARRIAVDDPPGLDEETALSEARDDGLLRRIGRDARQRPVVVVEDAGLVDRHEHRQLVHAAQLEVLGARARRDVDDARALVERDVVPRDDAVLDVRHCRRGRRRGRGRGVPRAPRPALARRSPRPAGARRRTTRRRRCARTRRPAARRQRRSREASTASSSR